MCEEGEAKGIRVFWLLLPNSEIIKSLHQLRSGKQLKCIWREQSSQASSRMESSPCSEEILRWIELHSSQGALQNAQSVTRNRAVFRGYSRVRWKLHRCGITISTDHSTLKLWLFSVPLSLVQIAVKGVLRGDKPAQSEHPVCYNLARKIKNRLLSHLLPIVGVW